MKILIFDTETGGISPEQNDILQLSYQVIESDTEEVLKEVNHYFPWPEDKWRVQEGAINVNGLTEEFLATKELSNRYDALEEFFEDMSGCDYLVAHNGDFDKRFIIAEAQRQNYIIGPDEFKAESKREQSESSLSTMPSESSLELLFKPMIDTMKTTTELCKLPPHPGRTGYKWPRLYELAEHLCIPMDDINLHDSSADVELTKRCFLHLLKEQFYTL